MKCCLAAINFFLQLQLACHCPSYGVMDAVARTFRCRALRKCSGKVVGRTSLGSVIFKFGPIGTAAAS